MEEMQSILQRIKTNHDDLEAWQRLGELVDDPREKNDCREQVARIRKELGSAEVPAAAPAGSASAVKIPFTANLLGGRLPLITIIVSNLVPVFGILFLHWSMGSVMVLYWVENVMVGFFTILKMIFADSQAGNWLARLGLILFFCVHFGGFCVVHLLFIVMLFLASSQHFLDVQAISWDLLNMLAGLWLPILAMFISYSVYFYHHYLGDGIYQRVTLTTLMVEPYPRIIPMHFGLIIGGFFILAIGSPIVIVLLLVALKTGAEVMAYQRSVAKWRAPAGDLKILPG